MLNTLQVTNILCKDIIQLFWLLWWQLYSYQVLKLKKDADHNHNDLILKGPINIIFIL